MIEPTDRPEDYVAYDIDVEEATRKGLENRPELAVAQGRSSARRCNLKFAKNQRLPQLDLVGTYGNEGLAGDTNPDCATSDLRAGPARSAVGHDYEDELQGLLHAGRRRPRRRGRRVLDPDSATPAARTTSRRPSSSCAARWSRSGASSSRSCSRCAWRRAT